MILEQRRIDTKALLYVIGITIMLVIALNYVPKQILAKLYVAVLLTLIILFALVLKTKSITY